MKGVMLDWGNGGSVRTPQLERDDFLDPPRDEPQQQNPHGKPGGEHRGQQQLLGAESPPRAAGAAREQDECDDDAEARFPFPNPESEERGEADERPVKPAPDAPRKG